MSGLFSAKFKRNAVLILVTIFMCIWIPGMTAALTAKTCANPKYAEATRLRFCNFSLTVVPVTVFATEGHKVASIQMERAILLANTGDVDAARQDMQRALKRASSGNPRAQLRELARQLGAAPNHPNIPATFATTRDYHWLLKLLVRAQQPDVSETAARIWNEVLDDAQTRPDA